MPQTLKEFQEQVCRGVLHRWTAIKGAYDRLGPQAPDSLAQVRRQDAAIVLQAPTGSGKTLLAIEVVARFAATEPGLWFWFAPFAGVVEQARRAIADQAPQLRLLDLARDRGVDTPLRSGIFVTTWQSVAARNADGRKARQGGDAGLSVDALIERARAEGLRIGCVVDEAHHGFHRAREAQRFFADVLRPDYALMMTATPRDHDAQRFAEVTGYRVGGPEEWASVSRYDGVKAGLLKRGVKMVRFIAKREDEKRLVDFEHVALAECVRMHREIKQRLAERGIALTPLMLVQVPDGKERIKEVQKTLVKELRFPESAVRIHTADEPDADVLALAHDPSVEVLIFKMAVALGFDAPRAFTLAALRGARDESWGVQVVGRLMRVHLLLQQRRDLPPELDYGYVFLANSEAQEGLLNAGELINALDTHAPELGTQTVVTVIGDTQQVQVARSGESLSLLIEPDGTQKVQGQERAASAPDFHGFTAMTGVTASLFGPDQMPLPEPQASGRSSDPMIGALILDSKTLYRFKRKPDAPDALYTEVLPPPPLDLEQRLAEFVDFTPEVLASRERVRAQVRRSESDIFGKDTLREGDGQDVWATLRYDAIAARAEQLMLKLSGLDPRSFQNSLLERFRGALEREGMVPPEDEELLHQQLDLVLVRHPALLREANRRLRMQNVVLGKARLPDELVFEYRLQAARRNIYGVMPPDLNSDELPVAQSLDEDATVLWWHRNPSRQPQSVALYGWDDGEGYFPDFVVALKGRETDGGIALLEVKGAHLWDAEKDKADAKHLSYGRCFMVGRKRGGEFEFLRLFGSDLQPDGRFEPGRMRWG
jgi:superfamily II DNA or RNA helicase